MPGLRHLLTAHAPLLVLDAASSRVQAGLLSADGGARWEQCDDEAGVGVFRCVEQLGVKLGEVGAFVFCDGPGSVLGVRTVAMALRTWGVLAPRPVFAYHSLALVAHALGDSELRLIADARRDSWHCFSLAAPQLARVPAAALAGRLVMPENFRHWSPLPPGVGSTPYALADLFPRAAEADLFRAVVSPDAFLHEEPGYATWMPQIHRAPAAPC